MLLVRGRFDHGSHVRIVNDPRHSRRRPIRLSGFLASSTITCSNVYAKKERFESSVPVQSLAPKGEHMKKTRAEPKAVREVDDDEILPEYDFSKGRRNKYAARYAEGTNLILLDPDVAKDFPDSNAVNDALRGLSAIIRRRGKSRRTA